MFDVTHDSLPDHRGCLSHAPVIFARWPVDGFTLHPYSGIAPTAGTVGQASQNWFLSLEDAEEKAKNWRRHYNGQGSQQPAGKPVPEGVRRTGKNGGLTRKTRSIPGTKRRVKSEPQAPIPQPSRLGRNRMSEKIESCSDSADQWVSNVISEARDSNPLVAEEVFTRIETLLEGQMSERNLTRANLKLVATQLLGVKVYGQSELEEKHED